MARPPVTISPLQHRGARRIKVECPPGTEISCQIKMYEEKGRTDARACATHRWENGGRVELAREVWGSESIKNN